jgi:phosphate/sulfate permease
VLQVRSLLGVVSDVTRTSSTADLTMGVDVGTTTLVEVQVGRVADAISVEDGVVCLLAMVLIGIDHTCTHLLVGGLFGVGIAARYRTSYILDVGQLRDGSTPTDYLTHVQGVLEHMLVLLH